MNRNVDIWTVYEHISPSGKVYTGITSNLKGRWGNNGHAYCTYNSAFKRAIIKYGWDNITHKVIASGLGFNTACNMEKDFIAFNKARGISYNITDGGQGTSGRILSEETKAKISKSHMGILPSPLAIQNSLNSPKRKKAILQNLKLANVKWKGSHHTDETRKKLSDRAKGRDMSKAIEASRKVPHNFFKRGVTQYSLDGTYINEYVSIAQAARELNILASAISNCLKGRTDSSGGYIWKYKNMED